MTGFTRAGKPTDQRSSVTTVAAGTRITGRIRTENDLHVDGELEGEVHSAGTVTVSRTGTIRAGTLVAGHLVVYGRFFGTADCDRIELTSGGEAEGKFISAGLVIDADSAFEGELVRRKQSGASRVLEFSRDTPVRSGDGAVNGNPSGGSAP